MDIYIAIFISALGMIVSFCAALAWACCSVSGRCSDEQGVEQS